MVYGGTAYDAARRFFIYLFIFTATGQGIAFYQLTLFSFRAHQTHSLAPYILAIFTPDEPVNTTRTLLWSVRS